MVKIEVRGLEAMMNVIASAEHRGINARPLMLFAGEVMRQSVTRNFEDEGRPRWHPWSQSTVRSYNQQAVARARNTKAWQRAKAKGRASVERKFIETWVKGGKLLVRSGDLRKSIEIGVATAHSVEIGSSLPYARIHQLGGTIPATTITAKRAKYLSIPTAGGVIFRKKANRPAVRIPARPYLLLQGEDKTTIVKAAKEYFLTGRI